MLATQTEDLLQQDREHAVHGPKGAQPARPVRVPHQRPHVMPSTQQSAQDGVAHKARRSRDRDLHSARISCSRATETSPLQVP